MNFIYVPFMLHVFLSFSFHGVSISFHVPVILHFMFLSFCIHVLSLSFHCAFMSSLSPFVSPSCPIVDLLFCCQFLSLPVMFLSDCIHFLSCKNVTLNTEGVFPLDTSCHFALISFHVPLIFHSFLSCSVHGVFMSFHSPFILHSCPLLFLSFRTSLARGEEVNCNLHAS